MFSYDLLFRVTHLVFAQNVNASATNQTVAENLSGGALSIMTSIHNTGSDINIKMVHRTLNEDCQVY